MSIMNSDSTQSSADDDAIPIDNSRTSPDLPPPPASPIARHENLGAFVDYLNGFPRGQIPTEEELTAIEATLDKFESGDLGSTHTMKSKAPRTQAAKRPNELRTMPTRRAKQAHNTVCWVTIFQAIYRAFSFFFLVWAMFMPCLNN